MYVVEYPKLGFRKIVADNKKLFLAVKESKDNGFVFIVWKYENRGSVMKKITITGLNYI